MIYKKKGKVRVSEIWVGLEKRPSKPIEWWFGMITATTSSLCLKYA